MKKNKQKGELSNTEVTGSGGARISKLDIPFAKKKVPF
jgi:hypothetical protein